MTSKLEGWLIGNIEKFLKNVTSIETNYQWVLGE